MTLLLDDQHLGGVLRGDPPPGDGQLFTTGYWYVRLCQAVLAADHRIGTLSRPFEALRSEVRTRALQAVLELPESIGLLSLRELAPVIGELRRRHDLNILGMEAQAAARQLGATVHLMASSPRLEEALRVEGLDVVVAGGRH